MNKNELKIILAEGEGYGTEFKESLDRSIAREMAAFSNSSGGRILLGVTDKGEPRGIKITNKLKAAITDIGRNCDPPIAPSIEAFGNIMIVNIAEGANKPYQCGEGFFMRTGAVSQKLKRDEILKFIISDSFVYFDKEINRDFNISKDFDKNKFKEVLKLADISVKERYYKIALKNMGIGKISGNNYHINNAGVLMFAKDPEKFFRHSFITCVLYQTDEKVKILDRKDFTGTLLYNYDGALTFLKKHLRLEYIIDGAGPREEVLEIPQSALRESLLNAIIHRDYYDRRAGIFVEIFRNRVDITNKGALLFSKKYFGKISVPRNPVLFDLFHRIHFKYVKAVSNGK